MEYIIKIAFTIIQMICMSCGIYLLITNCQKKKYFAVSAYTTAIIFMTLGIIKICFIY